MDNRAISQGKIKPERLLANRRFNMLCQLLIYIFREPTGWIDIFYPHVKFIYYFHFANNNFPKIYQCHAIIFLLDKMHFF